jgi:hypothetical protein
MDSVSKEQFVSFSTKINSVEALKPQAVETPQGEFVQVLRQLVQRIDKIHQRDTKRQRLLSGEYRSSANDWKPDFLREGDVPESVYRDYPVVDDFEADLAKPGNFWASRGVSNVADCQYLGGSLPFDSLFPFLS